MTVSVLLVDDQEMVRAALRAVLDRRADLAVAGEAADGEQAVREALRLRPDVVVMDVRMPGVNGVEATRRILAGWPPDAGPPPRVLVLTTFDLDEYVHSALRAGASGFLLKNSPAEEFAQAVRVVAAGEAMLAPSVTRRLIGVFTALPAG
ncbi:response regulator transcription factor, partial [Spirillospora sp. NPDC049652]